MKLFISEKPSVSKALAEAYALKTSQKMDYHGKTIHVGDDVFVALAGHVLRNKDVVEYKQFSGFKWYMLNQLPIIPEPFEYAVNFDLKEGQRDTSRHEAILNGVEHYLSRADEVIHVGDPDDEGQLLVDEVIEYFGYNGKVSRLWTSSISPQALSEAIDNIKPNALYYSKGLAAKARSHIDWLHGINFTILISTILAGNEVKPVLTPKGVATTKKNRLYSVGRVQTPVLNLIYQCEQEHKNFVPIDYYGFNGVVSKNEQSMKVSLDMQNKGLIEWMESKGALNSDGKLVSLEVAQQIEQKFETGRKYPVSKAETKDGKESAPLAFSLAELLKECGKRFGFSVPMTQDLANDLYLKAWITYPRNKDCRHIRVEDFKHGESIVASLKSIQDLKVDPVAFSLADTTYQGSKVWNDKEVAKAAHPAIIPTGTMTEADYNGLSENHKKVYSLIAQFYLYQFMQPATFKQFSGIISHDADQMLQLKLTGKQWVDRSWKVLDSQGSENDEVTLPVLNMGDLVSLDDFGINAQKTERPKLFDEVALLDAMINAHRYVQNEELRDILRGKSEQNNDEYSVPVGIGTDSTRANIIQTLLVREYMLKDDKGRLTVTEKGRSLLESIPNELKWVDSTAEMQQVLDDLRGMELNDYLMQYEDVMQKQKFNLRQLLYRLKEELINKTGYQERSEKVITPLDVDCPCCQSSKLEKVDYQYNGEQKSYIACSPCKKYFALTQDGKPVEKIYRETEHKCQKCQSKLIEKKGVSEKGEFHFYGCSNKDCNDFYDIGEGGEPVKSSKFPLTEYGCQKCDGKLYHIKLDKTQPDGSIKHINMFSCQKCETIYNADKSGEQPKYPVYLSATCPYCNSQVEHLQGISKTGTPYNMGRCVKKGCAGNENPLPLDVQNNIALKFIPTKCGGCGGKILMKPLRTKKGETFYLYTCQGCGANYLSATDNDFADRFEVQPNRKGGTEKWLKGHKCQKCKTGYVKYVTFSQADAAAKNRTGYYGCSNGQCSAFYTPINDGAAFKLNEK